MNKSGQIALLITLFYFTIFVVINVDIPFFWDGTFFSAQAISFFDNGLNSLIPDNNHDTGGFPLVGLLLSISWKIAGKSLLSSHLLFLALIYFTVFQFYRFARYFLNDHSLIIALVLLCIEPTFNTQSILMGYDLFLCAFFLAAINNILHNNNKQIILFLTLLLLCNVRAIPVFIALFFVHLYIKKGQIKTTQFFFCYSIPLFFISIWFLYHRSKTGWFLFSPLRENTDEKLVEPQMMIRQLLYICWKIGDFGRIFLLVGIAYLSLFYKKESIDDRKLKIIFLVPVILSILFMIPFSNPAGHKYFLFSFPVLIVWFVRVLENKWKYKTVYSIGMITALILFSGNFWVYPQKYGNGWDSSLKVIPYFKLKKEMDQFILEKGIKPSTIATQFPIDIRSDYTTLTEQRDAYVNTKTEDINKNSYFLYSTILNMRNIEEVERIRTTWTLLKEAHSGMIKIELYKKP